MIKSDRITFFPVVKESHCYHFKNSEGKPFVQGKLTTHVRKLNSDGMWFTKRFTEDYEFPNDENLVEHSEQLMDNFLRNAYATLLFYEYDTDHDVVDNNQISEFERMYGMDEITYKEWVKKES